MRKRFVCSLLLAPALLCALASYPMKISVQTGDTLSFPLFLKGWDTTATGVTVLTSTPLHGTVRPVIGWFDSTKYFIGLDTIRRYVGTPRGKTPARYPGLRYIPDAGFTGRDSFTFRVRTSNDSTLTATCAVRVTPPEPGNMTVLLVVHGTLLPSIQAEVERLKTDLQNEGYVSRIVPFTPAGINTAEAKRLWDTLRTEYDKPSSMLAGAILIGKLPYYSTDVIRESAFWSMSLWEADMETAGILGFKVGPGSGYNGNHYTPGFTNIWVSCMNGTSSYGAVMGTETELIKRILQNNHDYRTGISRLPRTALSYDMCMPNVHKFDPRKYLDVWPSQLVHASNDSTSPFNLEFRKGGEIWEVVTHGNENYFSALLNTNSPQIWRYGMADLQNAIPSFRFLVADLCHAGGFGKLENGHLLVKNSGVVLTMGSTDYVTCGFYLADTGKSYPFHTWTRNYLAKGDRWGRAWLRGNGWIWSVIFHGDLSLKPNMGPSNEKPRITRVTASKTGTMSWNFSVTATDADDGVIAYDWYGKSYRAGAAQPDSSGPSNTFSVSYTASQLCTVRVEVADHYKARDWATVILKTDSGVVKSSATEDALSPFCVNDALSLCPNPFNPGTTLYFGGTISGAHPLTVEVLSADGRLVRTLAVPAGKGRIVWNGTDEHDRLAGTGMYIFRTGSNGRIWQTKGILIK